MVLKRVSVESRLRVGWTGRQAETALVGEYRPLTVEHTRWFFKVGSVTPEPPRAAEIRPVCMARGNTARAGGA